jgi:G3E family GTPase
MTGTSTKCPVTIVTGFLGSGKTTLLAHVLAESSMGNTAVLVNEFGKVGLDHHLLRQVNEHTLLLGNGCACCTVRDDLVKTLLELYALDERGDISRLERVIIETSGLADPAPILFTILTDTVLQHHFFVDRIITTVDAINGYLHLDRHPESLKQVAIADTIIITKTDIASEQEVNRLMVRLQTLNPFARVIQAVFGKVDLAVFLGSSNLERLRTSLGDDRGGYRLHDRPLNEHHHVAETHSLSLTFHQPLDWRAFGLWLSMLLHARGEDVLRVKGLIDVGEQGPVVLNGVQHIIHPPQHLARWPDEDHCSRIVFITRSIEPQALLNSLRVFQRALDVQASVFEANVQA